jgi:hypothetical protein
MARYDALSITEETVVGHLKSGRQFLLSVVCAVPQNIDSFIRVTIRKNK